MSLIETTVQYRTWGLGLEFFLLKNYVDLANVLRYRVVATLGGFLFSRFLLIINSGNKKNQIITKHPSNHISLLPGF